MGNIITNPIQNDIKNEYNEDIPINTPNIKNIEKDILNNINPKLSIYVLQLENNKYYIGKTKNLNFRMDQHFDSNGSTWTQINKPLKLLEINHNCDDFDEDKYTLKMMNQYGIKNDEPIWY